MRVDSGLTELYLLTLFLRNVVLLFQRRQLEPAFLARNRFAVKSSSSALFSQTRSSFKKM